MRPLNPFRPVFKFICVKSVVFLTYWQSMIVAVCKSVHRKWPDFSRVTPRNAWRPLVERSRMRSDGIHTVTAQTSFQTYHRRDCLRPSVCGYQSFTTDSSPIHVLPSLSYRALSSSK